MPSRGSGRSLPGVEKSKPRLLRHLDYRRGNTASCNLAFSLRLRFRLLWLRRHELRKGLPHAGLCRDVGDRGRGRYNGLGLDGLRRHDRREVGIEDDGLRPLPIGMILITALSVPRRCCPAAANLGATIGNEQQREQRRQPTKIPRQKYFSRLPRLVDHSNNWGWL